MSDAIKLAVLLGIAVLLARVVVAVEDMSSMMRDYHSHEFEDVDCETAEPDGETCLFPI